MLPAWFLRDQAENVKKPQGINAIDQLLQVEVGLRGRRISVESVESRGVGKVQVTGWPTVDGWNPAPLDPVDIPLFTGLYTSEVVQDFFHQQYWFWITVASSTEVIHTK